MYCTVDDLRKSMPDIRLVEATDDSNPNDLGSIQVAIAEEMILLACGIIDGFLALRLALPLPTVPVIIKKIAVDLAIYDLYERVGMVARNSIMESRRENAFALLKEIGKGNLSLGLPAVDAAIVEPAPSRILIGSEVGSFSMSSMASLGGGF